MFFYNIFCKTELRTSIVLYNKRRFIFVLKLVLVNIFLLKFQHIRVLI